MIKKYVTNMKMMWINFGFRSFLRQVTGWSWTGLKMIRTSLGPVSERYEFFGTSLGFGTIFFQDRDSLFVHLALFVSLIHIRLTSQFFLRNFVLLIIICLLYKIKYTKTRFLFLVSKMRPY